MTACDFQRALFRMLREKASRPRSFVGELSTVIYKSRPTIYKKMQGNIMLTVEELIAICMHYHIDVDPLLKGAPSFNAILLDDVDHGDGPDERLLNHIDKWVSEPGTKVLVDMTGMFTYAFLYPELAAFILFDQTVHVQPDCKFSFASARYDARLISVASRICTQYRKVDRCEIWRGTMLDHLLGRIVYHTRRLGFHDRRDPLRLLNVLQKSVAVLEERYDSRLDRNSGQHIYLSEFAPPSNRICTRNGKRFALYQGRWMKNWTLTYNDRLSAKSYSEMEHAIARFQFRNPQDTAHSTSFFVALNQKIQQTSRNIEQILLSSVDTKDQNRLPLRLI